MEFLFDMLKFGGAWFVGNLLFSTSVTIIGCCLFCAFPLLRDLKPYSDYIDVRRAKRLYRGSVLLHLFILAAASWAAVSRSAFRRSKPAVTIRRASSLLIGFNFLSIRTYTVRELLC